MLEFAMSYRCSSNDQRAVGHGLRDRLVLARSLEELHCGNGGDSLAERHLIGIDQAQRVATEVLHGTGGGPDIERIAWRDQDDDEIQSNKSDCSRVIRSQRG